MTDSLPRKSASSVSSAKFCFAIRLQIGPLFYISVRATCFSAHTQNMLFIFRQIGSFTLRHLSEMGRMFIFLLSAFALAFRRPVKLRLIVYHLKTIGVDS